MASVQPAISRKRLQRHGRMGTGCKSKRAIQSYDFLTFERYVKAAVFMIKTEKD